MATQLVCTLLGTQGRTAMPCVVVPVGLVVNLLTQQPSLVSLSLVLMADVDGGRNQH